MFKSAYTSEVIVYGMARAMLMVQVRTKVKITFCWTLVARDELWQSICNVNECVEKILKLSSSLYVMHQWSYLLMDKAVMLKTEAEMVKIATKLLILQSKWLEGQCLSLM